MASETTVDTKTECQTIKQALDAEIKRLEDEIDEAKVAVSAQRSLEKTIQMNDKLLKEIEGSKTAAEDLTDGAEVPLETLITELEVCVWLEGGVKIS